jgi:hypothetical protein
MPQNPTSCEEPPYFWDSKRAFRESDYIYARTRARLAKRRRRLERGYDVAAHFAAVIGARRRSKEQSLERSFREQVERWKNETGNSSSMTKTLAHPSYLRIIGLAKDSTGHELERLLLRELESDPDHWFAALSAVSGEDPVRAADDFDEAVTAWLDWGREKGIIER